MKIKRRHFTIHAFSTFRFLQVISTLFIITYRFNQRACHRPLGRVNPSNAETTYVQNTRKLRFLKTILTLSCWYSLESSRRVLSDEYLFARVLHRFALAKLATGSIRVTPNLTSRTYKLKVFYLTSVS